MRTGRGDLHATSDNEDGRERRVSASIVELEDTCRRATTRTGRPYIVDDPPDMDLDARYALVASVQLHRVPS